ncbi:MAG: metallophosphoesterase, partial [Nitrospirae bacterium]|nr:metallophosphoesterase [Nitrospirota bacterium]
DRSEKDILSGLPANLFTLLLKHRPDVDKDALGFFDLQLSGHTHKGQIFPFNLFMMLLFDPIAGYRGLAKGSALYVSRGAGTTCTPVRFLSRPELTIVELVADKIYE